MLCPSKIRHNGCPVTYALDSFGDRWSLLIIRDLLLRGFSTYGDFLDGGEGISTNILADRLKFLEANGILSKTPDPENRRRIIYALTEKGFDLAPVIFDLFLWSAQYDPETKAPKELVEKMAKDRESLLADIRPAGLGTKP
ncbi:MAG: helix-turn-helix transcriptional regulator [Alphaproteobacteria bacterium]|jgi:DNA-binding HxlR family transcriptional regulator|nr:helix-turn-helix transcriptional regulator [Alphaproteobacteria bacterium]MBT7943749.1 helix-turn-helix transcriptional regulator [Alphaproteobacteria bacterium]